MLVLLCRLVLLFQTDLGFFVKCLQVAEKHNYKSHTRTHTHTHTHAHTHTQYTFTQEHTRTITHLHTHLLGQHHIYTVYVW